MIRRVFFRFVAGFLLAASAGASAQVERIVLRVDGLACPFCAYGLEVMLKNVEGVLSMEILINDGKAILEWNEDKPIGFDRIKKAVDDAGFTLRSISVSFVGTLLKDREWYFISLPSPTNQLFYLFDPSHVKFKDIYSEKRGVIATWLSDATRQRLDGLIAGGNRVRIAGLVYLQTGKRRGLSPLLGITSLEEVVER